MDADRFDAVSRSYATTGRGALVALLGGALGVSGHSRFEEAWAESGKCKEPCGQRKTCKKGKCVRTPRQTL